MNYPPNAVDWPCGSLVIHDCDEKRSDRLLMRVLKRDGDMALTRYEWPRRVWPWQKAHHKKPKNRYWNHIENLHDPNLFGITFTNELIDQQCKPIVREGYPLRLPTQDARRASL